MESNEEELQDRIPSEDERTPKINKINSMTHDAMLKDSSSRHKSVSSKIFLEKRDDESVRDDLNSMRMGSQGSIPKNIEIVP